MEKLSREFLKDFYGYHGEKNINEKSDALEYLNKISNLLNNYEYENDADFVLLGRKKLILDEIMDIINGYKVVDNPIYFILGSLEEFICNNNHVSIADSPDWNNDWNDLRDRNDRYSIKNIICLEEKKYIDEIIKKIQEYISNNFDTKEIESNYSFYKKNDNDKIWWVENVDTIGEHLFSFDKQKIYNLFRDYPHNLTEEEKRIFDNENSYWSDFFKDRQFEKTSSFDNDK